jgi:hypothetical protein
LNEISDFATTADFSPTHCAVTHHVPSKPKAQTRSHRVHCHCHRLLLTLGGIMLFSLQRIDKAAHYELDITNALVRNMTDVRYHVVQIQQFLTDVSATGEADGYKDAEEHYQALLKILPTILRLEPQLNSQVTAYNSR